MRLLEEEGERELAISAHDLRMVGVCGCGDDFCQSIRTDPHPPGTPYGPGHRNVPLLPERGMLILDVVGCCRRPDRVRRDPRPAPDAPGLTGGAGRR
ncbi:hypothetical protein ACH4U5_12790 [Streptomyces sp. NPDC020858]|uniref:hypothetical protein n=1 Tax=Streptomyces sp. NPDC020858 TaxID=3365097 RepID=UPI0037B6473D